MRVAQVDVNYLNSSTGKIVSDLASGLKKRGHSTIACFGRGSDPGIESVYKVSTKTEVMLHALGTRLTGLTGFFSPFATRRLIQLLSEYKPDVVHLHDLHGYFLNIGELVTYLKSNGIPTLWTFHCEFMYTGKCGYALDCEKWRSQCNDCPQLNSYPESWLFDFTAQMFEHKRRMFEGFNDLHLTAPSIWLADRMRSSVVVAGKQVTVVHNGIDTGVFCPRETNSLRLSLGLEKEWVVISVGSNLLSEIKGGRWVIELAKRNPEVIFLMVGVNNPPPFLPSNVKTIPPIHDQLLLAQYYSLGDVLLLTSAKETFSMVCAESLACGTPVIGFDSGAPKEVARPGFGSFVPYGDIELLNSLLRKVKSGEILLKTPYECEKFAASNYDSAVMVESFEKIYYQLTQKN